MTMNEHKIYRNLLVSFLPASLILLGLSGPAHAQPVCMANCTAATISNCTLPAIAHGMVAGTCAGGTCSYGCVNGAWSQYSANTCPAGASCGGQTISNCVLTAGTPHGSTSGTCSAGFTGPCTYTC